MAHQPLHPQAHRASRSPRPPVQLQQGAVRGGPHSKNSQAHPGGTALNPLAHRNTGFQPLPPPLGLPPYHYSLTDNFPAIATNITNAKKMTLHVLGDSGGVKDGEFQDGVAAALVAALDSADPASPQFCYHVGDVVYFTGFHDDYYAQFYEPYAHYTAPILAIP